MWFHPLTTLKGCIYLHFFQEKVWRQADEAGTSPHPPLPATTLSLGTPISCFLQILYLCALPHTAPSGEKTLLVILCALGITCISSKMQLKCHLLSKALPNSLSQPFLPDSRSHMGYDLECYSPFKSNYAWSRFQKLIKESPEKDPFLWTKDLRWLKHCYLNTVPSLHRENWHQAYGCATDYYDFS